MRILKDNFCSKNNDLRVTLDTIHQKKLQSFKENKKRISKLKKKLVDVNVELKKILKKTNRELNNEQIKNKFCLNEQKTKLKKDIENIKNDKQINDYYLNVGHILFQYYDKKKNPKILKKHNNKKNIKNKTIIDFFANSENICDNSSKNISETKSDDLISNDSNDKYKGNMKYMSKKKILNNYLSKTDSNYVGNSINNDYNYDICNNCNIEMSVIHSDGVIFCSKCGKQESVLINSDKPSYKDPPREMYYFAYKRIKICAEKHYAIIIWILVMGKH